MEYLRDGGLHIEHIGGAAHVGISHDIADDGGINRSVLGAQPQLIILSVFIGIRCMRPCRCVGHLFRGNRVEHAEVSLGIDIIFVFCKYFNLLIFEKFGHGDAPVILIYTYYIYTSRKFCGNLCFAGMDALEVLFNPFFSTN